MVPPAGRTPALISHALALVAVAHLGCNGSSPNAAPSASTSASATSRGATSASAQEITEVVADARRCLAQPEACASLADPKLERLDDALAVRCDRKEGESCFAFAAMAMARAEGKPAEVPDGGGFGDSFDGALRFAGSLARAGCDRGSLDACRLHERILPRIGMDGIAVDQARERTCALAARQCKDGAEPVACALQKDCR